VSGRRRRVLIIVNHAGFFLSHRLPVAIEARARGYDVHIATPRSRHVGAIEQTGLAWHEIRMARSSVAPWRELRSLISLFRLYRRLRPDLVHHVTMKPVLYGMLAARVAGVPAVVNAITGMGHVFSPVHGAPLLGRLIAALYRFVLRHRNMRVIFQNVEQRAEFVDGGALRPDEAVLIRGSGVDTSLFAPARVRRTGTPVVMMVSRMLVTKGVGEFVAAAGRLRADGVDARFVLVGEPDPDNPGSIAEAQLRAWAASGAVEYWGRRDDMPEVLRGADVVCLPSYYPEGVPKALIEAAATGLPIVATDIPGCRDIVEHGVTGLLVPYKDVPALMGALREVIENCGFRERAGRAGRERAVREFSLRQVLDATMMVYAGLLR
jgi:glycosyltransferase involved in cell wall biosynthesis